MNTLELIRAATGSDEEPDDSRSRDHHHFACESLELEPRQLLSAVQATTSAETGSPQAIGATGGLAGTGSTVQTHATGEIDLLQSQVPVNDLLSNLSQASTVVAETPSPISTASGLLSLPITPLLPPTVTENETPLNNGTPIDGTVWITPAPVPPGLFHPGTTLIPATTNTMVQTPNPQGGPPTMTHFGQGSGGTLSGATVQEPVAVGPIGPSMTEEIAPVQPPPIEAHQPVGPPTQVQQDETAPQQDAMTPPGGEQGAGQPGTPGQGAVPGQQGASGTQGQQGTPAGQPGQGAPTGTPSGAAGQGSQGGGALGGSGGSGGSSGGGAAFLDRPHLEVPGLDPDSTIDLIDAALPALALHSDPDAIADGEEESLPPLLGAVAVAVGSYHLALRGSDRRRETLVGGPVDAGGQEAGPDGLGPDS